MSSLVKLYSNFRTVRVCYTKKASNSVPTLGAGFSRLFGTPSTPTPPPSGDFKADDGQKTDHIRKPDPPTEYVNFFIQLHDGSRHAVKNIADKGLANSIVKFTDIIGPGYAACQNKKECSTCHVKFSREVFEQLPADTSGLEANILPLSQEYDENVSRLACCLKLTKQLEGVTIYLPKKRRDVRELFS